MAWGGMASPAQFLGAQPTVPWGCVPSCPQDTITLLSLPEGQNSPWDVTSVSWGWVPAVRKDTEALLSLHGEQTLSLGRKVCILSMGPVLSFPEGVALSKDTLLCKDVCFHSPWFWTRGRKMQNRLQWVVSAFMYLLQFLVKEALKKKKKIQMKQREQKGRVGKQSV